MGLAPFGRKRQGFKRQACKFGVCGGRGGVGSGSVRCRCCCFVVTQWAMPSAQRSKLDSRVRGMDDSGSCRPSWLGHLVYFMFRHPRESGDPFFGLADYAVRKSEAPSVKMDSRVSQEWTGAGNTHFSPWYTLSSPVSSRFRLVILAKAGDSIFGLADYLCRSAKPPKRSKMDSRVFAGN